MGVNYGIDESVIDTFINERQYGKPYVIAVGKEPRNGKDGYIEYKFNRELKPRPKMNDDGTVDFHSLENVNHVKQGDVVAVLHPEDMGDAGTDIFGKNVNPERVKHIVFRFGRNLLISEDGRQLISQVNGHVILEMIRFLFLMCLNLLI